jgi:hypothetical protein
VIGEIDPVASAATTPIVIDVAGAVTSRASVAGGVYTFTIAGTVVNTEPEKEDPNKTSKQDEANTGVGIAAAASVNIIKDRTQASVSDAIIVHRDPVTGARSGGADALDVKANNQNRIVAATAAWPR